MRAEVVEARPSFDQLAGRARLAEGLQQAACRGVETV
jgi:hypothetical protein